MRKTTCFLFASLFILAGCDLLNANKEETDPEKTLGKPGNYWSLYANGYTSSDFNIVSNDKGNCTATLEFGGKTIEVEGKITDNGIYDYVYSNGDKSKPFTLVKFDAKVGDKWEYNVGNKKVVREVTHKSTTDDTEYGFWLVKVVEVEETIPEGVLINGSVSGVKKIVWKFNHKFGLISATITETDNQVTNVTSITNAAD